VTLTIFCNFVTFPGGLLSALYKVAQKPIDTTDNMTIKLHLQNYCIYLLFEMLFQHGHLTNLGTSNYILKILWQRI